MSTDPPRRNWAFDEFKVMTEMRLLIARGAPVPLTSKAFDTLVVLIENRDRVVSKDELLGSVWSDVEVEEGNLTQQIFLLRKALGETAQQPRYILTIPGHGYRFTGRVEAIADQTGAASPTPAGEAVLPPAPQRRGGLTGQWLAVFGGIVVLAVVFGSRWLPSEKAPPVDFTRHITKVTESGKATASAMSRDGRWVAYVENDGDEFSLWVKRLGAEGATPLIPPQPLVLAHLSFSLDGEFLYFARGAPWRGVSMFLSRIPTLGGPETPLIDDVDTPVSFSPDGRQFAFIRGAADGSHLIVADAGGGSQKILAVRRGSQGFTLVAPDWSPDGKLVAAAAEDTSVESRRSIVVLPSDGSGNSRELFTTTDEIGRVRWLPDGSGLLTVISKTLANQFPRWDVNVLTDVTGGAIWRIAFPGGQAERVTSDLAEFSLSSLDVAVKDSAITGVVTSFVSDLWVAPSSDLNDRRQLTWGNPVVTRHSWLPDNDTIAYRDLSGRLNTIRVHDGRMTNLALADGRKVTGGVSVCGDGRYVVFEAVPKSGIWRIPTGAGGAERLTSGVDDTNPVCSHDGKWVIYSSAVPGSERLRRVPIDGGDSVLLVQEQSFDALPSPGGRLIYYAGLGSAQPGRRPSGRWNVISSTDGTALFKLDAPIGGGLRPIWAPDDSGLDYVVTRNGVSNIWRQPLTGGPPVQITRYSVGRIFSFAWSPDGKWLSLGSGVSRSDVVVMSSQS